MRVMPSDFIFESAEEYHARAKDYLSSHQLMSYEDSPALYAWQQEQPKADTAAFRFGRACHTFILEGEQAFSEQYVLASGDGAPVNAKTGKPFGYDTKKFQDWEREQKKTGITEDDFNLCGEMAAAVRRHETAANILSAGFPEAVLRETYCGTPCQIRIDWVNPARETVADLKTVSDITRFEYQFKAFRYANQMAFYAAVWAVRFGAMPSVSMIAAESNPPFRVGVWTLTPATLKEARLCNEMTIPKFIRSKQTGIYPTHYENERFI